MLRWFVRIAMGLAIAVAVLLLGVAVALLVGVRVSLAPLRPELEAAVSQALDRRLVLEGPVELVPSLWPTLQVEGVRVANPPGWPEGEVLRAELARVRIAVLPLLRGAIRVLELTAQGVDLELERRGEAEVNWAFGAPPAAPPPEEVQPPGPEPEPILLEFVGVDAISLERVRLVYRAPGALPEDLEIARLEGRVTFDRPLRLEGEGRARGEPWRLELEAGSPRSILVERKPWPLTLSLSIAGAELALSGLAQGRFPENAPAGERVVPLGLERLEVELALRGGRLDGFDRVARVALPPLGPFEVKGRLEATPEQATLRDVRLAVGGSDLTGEVALYAGEPPRLEVALASRLVALDDFDTGDWSPEEAPPPAAAEPAPFPGAERPRPLLSRELLSALDAKLTVRAARIRSGPDELGRGHLGASLGDGRFVLDPLHVEVPGGSLDAKLRYAPRREDVDIGLDLRIERFDYGVLLRRLAPEAELKGDLSLDLAVRGRPRRFDELLPVGSGHLDLAIRPVELEAGLADLWAVNLLAAVLPTLDKSEASTVNCVVARFDLADGVLTERAIFVDTTRMRVSGTGRVDFREEDLEFVLVPQPKRPEFFSLATPVRVEGRFDDFGAGVAPEDLLATVIRFVTSVVVVPVQRLFVAEPDVDAAECAAVLGEAR